MRSSDIEVALAAVLAGAEVVRGMYGTDLAHLEKAPTDFATAADLAAEDAIQRVIAEARPMDGFEGEETGAAEGTTDRRWLVDPLCGTLNFAAQTPLAAVNVALETADGIGVAVSADPVAQELFWTDGNASWLRRGGADTPLVPSSSSLTVDVNCDGQPGAPFLGAQLLTDDAFRGSFAPRVISSTLAVAWVAAGRRAAYVTDGALRGSVHFAAGIAICQAAGCIITDLAGAPIHTGRGLLAAADEDTHARLLSLIRPHLAEVLADA